jgi:hypothetical protein
MWRVGIDESRGNLVVGTTEVGSFVVAPLVVGVEITSMYRIPMTKRIVQELHLYLWPHT